MKKRRNAKRALLALNLVAVIFTTTVFSNPVSVLSEEVSTDTVQSIENSPGTDAQIAEQADVQQNTAEAAQAVEAPAAEAPAAENSAEAAKAEEPSGVNAPAENAMSAEMNAAEDGVVSTDDGASSASAVQSADTSSASNGSFEDAGAGNTDGTKDGIIENDAEGLNEAEGTAANEESEDAASQEQLTYEDEHVKISVSYTDGRAFTADSILTRTYLDSDEKNAVLSAVNAQISKGNSADTVSDTAENTESSGSAPVASTTATTVEYSVAGFHALMLAAKNQDGSDTTTEGDVTFSAEFKKGLNDAGYASREETTENNEAGGDGSLTTTTTRCETSWKIYTVTEKNLTDITDITDAHNTHYEMDENGTLKSASFRGALPQTVAFVQIVKKTVTETTTQKETEKATEKETQKVTEKYTEKITGKAAEKTTETETEKEDVKAEVPASAAMPAVAFDQKVTTENGTVMVHIDAEEGAFEEGTSMTVTPVTRHDILDKAIDAAGGKGAAAAMDITFTKADGTKTEPLKPIHVKMISPVLNHAEEAHVVHVADSGTIDVVARKSDGKTIESTSSEAASSDAKNAVSFESDSFSVYAIVYTVDFEYPVNGKMYQFSLPGGEKIALLDLIEVLGIIGDTNNGEKAAFNSVDSFLKEVANVEFSDESLVKVTKNEEGNDWTLESLEPFSTVETLTISLKNGEKVVVKVTDAPADFDPSTYTNIETVGHLEADLKEGTTVNYDAGSEEYKASVDSHFNISTSIAKEKKNFYVKLGSEIKIPDHQLNVVKRADDKTAKMHAFNYYFTKVDDDYYMVVEYQDKYLNDVAIVRQGNVSMDLLVGKLDEKDNENSKFDFTDNIPITVPNKKIEYPENENENSDIKVDKSYGGMVTVQKDGKKVTYLDYTVTVSSKKGTSEDITLQDTLKDLTLQLDPGGSKDVKVSDISIISVNPSGNASGQGSLTKDIDNNSFTLKLNKINGGEGSYTVTYRYTLDQEIPQELEEGQKRVYATGNNTIKAESGPIKHSDSDSFKIEKENKPVSIQKGGQYDPENNKITWTITLTLKNGNHDLRDDMFADANDLHVVKADGTNAEYTQSADKKTLHFPNAGVYTITYTTDAKPDAYAKYSVKNTATAEDGTKGESGPVDVPRTGEGEVKKEFSMSELVSESNGIEIYDLYWNVTFAVPETMRKGTKITDKVVLNQNYNDKLGYHEFTPEQQAEFLRLVNEAFGGTDLFDMSVNKSGNSTYEIILTLKEDYTRPADVASMKSISYKTTAKIDLAKANPGLVDGGATDTYKNTFTIGDLSATAQFNYKKEVNKIDYNHGQGGEKETNVTVKRTGDKTLVWAIVLNLQGDYNSMTVTDKLPAGLTVTKIMAGNQNNATIFEAPDFAKKYDYQPTNSVKSITANKTSSGTDLVIELEDDEDRADTYFKDGQRYYIYVHATIDDDQFDSLVNNVVEYTNNVSVTADGKDLGEDHQTQKTTLDSESIGKDTVQSAVSDTASKDEDWQKWHWLSYGVVINADGHEMNGGESFAMEDVLSFNKYSPDGVEVSFALVPNSVRLEVKNENGEWVDYPDDWTYQFKETKDGDLRLKTISLADLPDKTPLRLRYTYEVALDGNEPGKVYNIGDVKNIATIHGERDYSIEHHEQKNWEEFQSEASQTSSNTLNLSKVDLADYNTLLPGTKFVLEKWDGSKWIVMDAVSQESDRYLTTETDPTKFDGNGSSQPIFHENRSYTVYQTANLPGNRQNGALLFYMPVPGLDGYNGPYFEAGVCYRAREYEAPSGNGYMVDDNPDNQPAAYFYFSRNEQDREVGVPTQWPSDKIKNLADDISKESDAFYITNAKEPSLKITKKFTGDADITEAQKKAMSFDVYYAGEDGKVGGNDDIKFKTLTYADILSNKNILKASDADYGQYIKNKGVYYAVEHGIDLLGVNWTVTYIINNGVEESTDITDSTTFDSRTTVTTGSMTIENNVGAIDFINKYDIPKTSIKVTKEWLNPDGTTNANPDKTTIKFQVYQMEEGASKGHPYVPEGTDSPKTYEIKYEGGSWSEVTVKDLPKYADSVNRTEPYSYYVVETDPNTAIQTTYKIGEGGTEGDAASAASTDTTSPIVIVNKDTSVTVTKKFVDKLGNEKIPENGATIKFKILGQAKHNWDSGIEEKVALEDTKLRYNAADQQWYKDGTSEVFTIKLPTVKDNCTFLSYYVKEVEPQNYSVTYLINGLPQSDSNQLRNDETQTVTIVNAEKVPDGEIIVKKVWQNDEGEAIAAPNGTDSITVNLKQVPIIIEGKGNPATIKVHDMFNPYSEQNITDFQIGDIVTVSLAASDWIGPQITGGKYKDLGNNQYEIIITDPVIDISVNEYARITNVSAVRSSKQFPETEGATKQITISKNSNPSWVSEEKSLQELFGDGFDLYGYQIEESSVPPGFKVAYLYDGTYEDDEMTGSVSGGLLTVYNTKSNGSLKLKKNVTVNDFANGNSTLTNGTYTFNIVKSDNSAVTHEVKLTFAAGEITEATIDGVDAEADENGFYEVTNLDPGDYVITEAPVENGTKLTDVSGGKGDGSTETRNITVTVEAGKKGTEVPPAATAEFTNNINTGSITVTKSVEKPADLTLTQKFKIALKDSDGYYYKQDGTIATDETDKWIEFSTSGEAKTWSHLPVGKTYTVEEDTVTAPTGYICITEVSDEIEIEDVPFASGTATVTNKYQQTETEYSFKKIWLDSNGANANKQTWPDGKKLGITLYRNATYKKTNNSDAAVQEERVGIYAIPLEGLASNNITVTKDETNTWYVVKFAKLDKYVPAEKLTDPQGDVEWTYYVKETTVPDGFSLQYGDANGNVSQSSTFSKEGESVINSLIEVTLPSTGGPGTRFYYSLGIAFIAMAGIILFIKRKEMRSLRGEVVIPGDED
jgi:hypothetical protein